MTSERTAPAAPSPWPTLDELIEVARAHVQCPRAIEDQVLSFAYGNAALSNPDVTREVVDAMAAKYRKPVPTCAPGECRYCARREVRP